MNEQRPIGQFYHEIYIEPPEQALDSARARLRVARLMGTLVGGGRLSNVFELIESKLGVRVQPHVQFDAIIAGLSLHDYLATITLAWRVLDEWDETNIARRQHTRSAAEWVVGVNEIFVEQHISFTVDEKGGVHPKYDVAFNNQRADIIDFMRGQPFEEAARYVEAGYRSLTSTSPNTREAVRNIFEAVESVAKQHFQIKLLAPNEVNNLSKLVTERYAGTTHIDAANQLVSSFRNWVTAMQGYRHAQGHDDHSAEPPLSLALQMFSTGIANLRWLVALIQAK